MRNHGCEISNLAAKSLKDMAGRDGVEHADGSLFKTPLALVRLTPRKDRNATGVKRRCKFFPWRFRLFGRATPSFIREQGPVSSLIHGSGPGGYGLNPLLSRPPPNCFRMRSHFYRKVPFIRFRQTPQTSKGIVRHTREAKPRVLPLYG